MNRGSNLNLVPLQNNMFNNCKSELKFFEAGIVEVPSVALPLLFIKKILEMERMGFYVRRAIGSLK
jgi:hypothetical protein